MILVASVGGKLCATSFCSALRADSDKSISKEDFFSNTEAFCCCTLTLFPFPELLTISADLSTGLAKDKSRKECRTSQHHFHSTDGDSMPGLSFA